MATKELSVIRDKKTGNIKNLRDKKLKDAKPKTTVAQTDAVRMKTVDNQEVYIDRNSLVQAVAEVLNSNSQSTITTLFGADANGNHANINMANLASVLSEDIYGIAHSKKLVFKEVETSPFNIAKDYFNNLSLNYYGELFVIASSNAFIKVWKANAHDVGRIEIKYIGSGTTDVYKRASTDSDFVKV